MLTRWLRGKESALDGKTDSMGMSLSKLLEMVKDKEACCAAVYGVAKRWTRLSNQTTATTMPPEVEVQSLNHWTTREIPQTQS